MRALVALMIAFNIAGGAWTCVFYAYYGVFPGTQPLLGGEPFLFWVIYFDSFFVIYLLGVGLTWFISLAFRCFHRTAHLALQTSNLRRYIGLIVASGASMASHRIVLPALQDAVREVLVNVFKALLGVTVIHLLALAILETQKALTNQYAELELDLEKKERVLHKFEHVLANNRKQDSSLHRLHSNANASNVVSRMRSRLRDNPELTLNQSAEREAEFILKPLRQLTTQKRSAIDNLPHLNLQQMADLGSAPIKKVGPAVVRSAAALNNKRAT